MLLGLETTLTAYMQQLSTRPLLTVYIASIFQNSLSTSYSFIALITTSIGYSKKLSNLAKIYIDDIKYSGHNNSFIFTTLAIFYNIYSKSNIST